MILFLKIIFKEWFNYLTNSKQRSFLWLVIKYGDKKRFKEETIKIKKIILSVPDCLSFIWQYKDIFVDENYRFNTKVDTPVIIDCGANIGLSILYFKTLYPNSKVIAFEASPDISKNLRMNIENNGIKNVEIYNKAVWIHDNGIELTLEGADGSSIFGSGSKAKVESMRLKTLLEKENSIDFLKMDIEGAEVQVIKDCENSLDKVANIFIEYHSFDGHKQELSELLSILTKNNFRYFIRPVNDRLHPFINKTDKNYPQFDLQINIFAYKN